MMKRSMGLVVASAVPTAGTIGPTTGRNAQCVSSPAAAVNVAIVTTVKIACFMEVDLATASGRRAAFQNIRSRSLLTRIPF
jgi:hypothetical protein